MQLVKKTVSPSGIKYGVTLSLWHAMGIAAALMIGGDVYLNLRVYHQPFTLDKILYDTLSTIFTSPASPSVM